MPAPAHELQFKLLECIIEDTVTCSARDGWRVP